MGHITSLLVRSEILTPIIHVMKAFLVGALNAVEYSDRWALAVTFLSYFGYQLLYMVLKDAQFPSHLSVMLIVLTAKSDLLQCYIVSIKKKTHHECH